MPHHRTFRMERIFTFLITVSILVIFLVLTRVLTPHIAQAAPQMESTVITA